MLLPAYTKHLIGFRQSHLLRLSSTTVNIFFSILAAWFPLVFHMVRSRNSNLTDWTTSSSGWARPFTPIALCFPRELAETVCLYCIMFLTLEVTYHGLVVELYDGALPLNSDSRLSNCQDSCTLCLG